MVHRDIDGEPRMDNLAHYYLQGVCAGELRMVGFRIQYFHAFFKVQGDSPRDLRIY